ncbi:hypothetical protein [Nitrosomonas sp.]|uniref:hypothetical protein n=1 Tax=Nitrosomonas sp. TaxID=42353 RepID=UPI001DFB5C55|nr:hypothetical protein [Nitrosomonas sp.]MBX3616866.1 hypothetical protein [Nitrosomonas sp.]
MFSFEKRIHQGLFFLFLFFLVCGANVRAAGDTQTASPEIKIENISISLMGQEAKKAEVKEDEEGRRFLKLQIGINDRLRLEVRNLQTLIDAKNECSAQSNCKRNIALYFNGMKISELSSTSIINLERNNPVGAVEFVLKYDASAEIKQNWASLLGAPVPNWKNVSNIFKAVENNPPEPGFFTRPVDVAIGLDDGSKWVPFEHKEEKTFYVVFEQVNPIKFWIFFIFLIIIFIFTWVYRPLRGALKEALSDIGPKPQSGTKPWSLARCQMAFWFVLVTISYVSIWVTTGALDAISDSALALIGIGTGAALGSVAIDISEDSQLKRIDLEQKLIGMQEEAKGVEQELQQNSTLNYDQKKYKERMLSALQHNQVQMKEKILRIIENNPSQGFSKDILNDLDGDAALHRIQIVIWTLILGIIYIYSVWETLAMPEFSPTLLALQGLSAGAYLGFKIPDKKS